MTITVTISVTFSFPALRRDGAFVPHLCSVRNRRLWFSLKRCFRALRGSLDWEQVYCTKEYRRENGVVQKNVSQDTSEQEQSQNASCGNKKKRGRLIRQADPTERSWRGVLRGHVPSKSLSADSEIPAPLLLGARRRWVRKATAFRGRSEQDRSALVSRLLCSDFENIPVECFQRDFPFLKLADTARRVPTNISPKHLASCAQLEQPFRGSGSEIVLFLHDAFCIL